MILFENTAGAVVSYCAVIPISGVNVPDIASLDGSPPSVVRIAVRLISNIIRSPLFIPLVLVTEVSGSWIAMTPKWVLLRLSIIVKPDPDSMGV